MNKSELDLLHLVALQLTGKDIQIRDREPATRGLLGEIHRDLEGQLIIDISPNIPNDEKRLDVILHEFAHAKHHNFIRSDYYKTAPASVPKEPLDNWDRRREDTAEKEAAAWKTWGDVKARQLVPDLYKIAPIDAVLIALLTYKKEDK